MGVFRKPLPRGISRTRTGWRISVRVHGHPLFQRRFKAHVSQETVEAELRRARQMLHAGRTSLPPGTLAADVERYLTDYFTGRAGYAERERHLRLWIKALGPDVWRAQVTKDDVARVLNQWRAAGLAADTCNKRRTALLALYHALDGKGGSNPVREVEKFRAPDPLPRGIAYQQIEAALEQLPRCKTRARLAVIAYTGIRHGQLMQLTADYWDHKGRTLTVPGTSKGRGTKPYVIPLSQQAHDALVEFDTQDAWGTFTWAPMARLWRQAWYAMTTKQPRTPRLEVPSAFVAPVPYDLRHSFGSEIYRQTGDIKAAQKLLGHSSIRMTERYTLAAVPERLTRAVRAFEAGMTRPGRTPKRKSSRGRKLPLSVATRGKVERTRAR